jgi:hypothetical protein
VLKRVPAEGFKAYLVNLVLAVRQVSDVKSRLYFLVVGTDRFLKLLVPKGALEPISPPVVCFLDLLASPFYVLFRVLIVFNHCDVTVQVLDKYLFLLS